MRKKILYLTQRYVRPPYRQAFINGRILTMDARGTVAEAVVVERDRILMTGSVSEVSEFIESRARVVDLQGKTMMPGIVDAHSHFPGSGLSLVAVDFNSPPIGTVKKLEDGYSRLREKAATTRKGRWILAFGFDDTMIAERRYPSLAELDAISTKHPVFVLHISAHTGVGNSMALALAGITRETPDPAGGRIGRDPVTGELTGLVAESAVKQMTAMATSLRLREALRVLEAAGQQYVSAGVTTAQVGLLTDEYRKSIAPFARMNLLPVRLVVLPGEEVAQEILDGRIEARDTPRLHWGAFKLVLDGSIQAFTAHLSRPYYRPPVEGYRGYLALDEPHFRETILRYHAAGRQIAVHTNGDAAMDLFIDAFAAAQKVHRAADPRAILIHAQTIRPDQLDRARDLGMTPSFFSAHVYYWGDRHRDIFLGPERAAAISPAQTASKKGVRFTTHLDTPVVPMDPWLLAWSAVNRRTAGGEILGPEERIDAMTALRAMTIDAAWQSFLEEDLGSIEPGKYADLIILSEDPLRDPANLRSIKVLMTMVGGVTVFER
jgi:predicted amidohydrolase YtcJ